MREIKPLKEPEQETDMTWDELKKTMPDAKKSKWHRHENGDGWVENTATVEASACVSGNA